MSDFTPSRTIKQVDLSKYLNWGAGKRLRIYFDDEVVFDRRVPAGKRLKAHIGLLGELIDEP